MTTSTARTPLVACIDDNHELVGLIDSLLCDEGYQTATVVSAPDSYLRHAADVLSVLLPDVAVVAIGFPVRQQWPAFQALRQALPRCGFVVATTDRGLEETAPRLLDDGVIVIGMPFDLDALLSAVRDLALRSGTRAEEAAALC